MNKVKEEEPERTDDVMGILNDDEWIERVGEVMAKLDEAGDEEINDLLGVIEPPTEFQIPRPYMKGED